VKLKKSLSQNFLINDRAAKRIVDSLDLNENDFVLEIGAGSGALTKHLLHKAKKVVAVEIDKQLCGLLQQKFASHQNLSIVNADILKVNLRDLIQPEPSCKVAGNLPYQITSPVLSLLLENRKLIDACVVTVQKEVALRLSSKPGNKDWSPLSIAVQLYANVKILFHLKPGSFFPRPGVDSSVIRLLFLPQPRVRVQSEKLFFKVVRAAFGQRRKILLNSLAANLDLPKDQLEVIFNRISLDPKRRAETLDMDEFAQLSSAMCESLK
jgi:16S rRNA (adenine1518-N6/adenine1519-N6)-dimethyltransferase